MGRSLVPAREATTLEPVEPAGSFLAPGGLRYLVEHRGSRVFHTETLLGIDGQQLAQTEAEIEVVLGSGTRGRSYLVNRNGYLFQSPVAWFTQRQCWDLSPGYTDRNLHFERPITPGCLFCHSNYAEHVEHTMNRYESPIFRGFAVGCERCHGPGELHARQPGLEAEADYIVNPRRLKPELREAVCQQCHLQGDLRILRANREVFDYRPGLPLHLFWSVFVRSPDFSGFDKSVGQVEQMYSSRCYRGSNGQLGCISCHDPHRVIAPDERIAHYRDRCAGCHATADCSLPLPDRTQRNENNCIACHMPPLQADIPHTAMSDHRIPRRPEDAEAPSPDTQRDRSDTPVAHFHADIVDARDDGIQRDRAVALALLARETEEVRPRTWLARTAQPLLESAVNARPDDVPAWEALGYAHWSQGRFPEAESSFSHALNLAPTREATLIDLAQLNARLGRHGAALEYLQRAIAVNPYMSAYHAEVARLQASRGQWKLAAQACRTALQLNPAEREYRKALVTALLRSGAEQEAQHEFALLLQCEPPVRHEALRRWFADRAQR
jgi:Flp pilus assembly protein TadD